MTDIDVLVTDRGAGKSSAVVTAVVEKLYVSLGGVDGPDRLRIGAVVAHTDQAAMDLCERIATELTAYGAAVSYRGNTRMLEVVANHRWRLYFVGEHQLPRLHGLDRTTLVWVDNADLLAEGVDDPRLTRLQVELATATACRPLADCNPQ